MSKSIIRVEHDKDNPYIVINKSCVRNPDISLAAKGLHLWMLSFPDDWTFYIEYMAENLKESRNTIYKLMNELKKFGYIERRKTRDEATKRITGTETVVHESPHLSEPYTKKPTMEKPKMEKPDTGICALLSNDSLLSNKEELSNDIVSENEPIEKPNVDSESATAFPSENTEGHPPQVDLFGETPELSLELQEKQIRAEMRNAYCWMMYGHADLKSLSGKEIKAINSEIARIRKNTRKYSAEHMRRWWADIWGDEWFNKGRTVTTYQQASMSQIRNGMSQAWEAMNNIEIEIIESSSPKPVVMNSQMAEQFLGGEYAS